MNKPTDMQRKVDEAMESVLNIGRATPSPFFYTRLMARIHLRQNNYWDRMGNFVGRPAFAFVTVSLVLMLNIFVAINETSTAPVSPDLSEVATADDLGTNTFYDIENVQP